jgi:hypothetical protein
MRPELRRIIAAEAQRRRNGRCPAMMHSLGTGESFSFVAREDGFVDAASGIEVRSDADRILLPDGTAILFALDGDVGFAGYDPVSRERFTGRGAAGASVTIYDARGDFFQYAMLEWEGA